ncbi:SMI1/KNR4 family protein [Chitinophaga sp. YIM B06452]|uniref:SMI1/KNR4 family protein n=1 Tax=Chitinophaga sp. YIM B06452 TaxID=3082158 RepID=UPI0031FEFC49
MNEALTQLTVHLSKNEKLENDQFSEWVNKINLNFPSDYLDFMLERNGGEGSIGSEGYVRFWPMEELIEANNDYSVSEFAPGLFFHRD